MGDTEGANGGGAAEGSGVGVSPAEKVTRRMSERMGALLTMSVCGILCGLMMWIAFAWVSRSLNIEDLFGAMFGGWLAGIAMYALS